MCSPLKHTENWLKNFVLAQNLCPFAKKPFEEDTIRYALSRGDDAYGVCAEILHEIQILQENASIQTSLLVIPHLFEEFEEYLDWFHSACDLIVHLELDHDFQLVSFHPRYCFQNTEPQAPENFTNRSPFPMVHILREADLSWAIENHENTHLIPEANINRLRELGCEKIRKILSEILKAD